MIFLMWTILNLFWIVWRKKNNIFYKKVIDNTNAKCYFKSCERQWRRRPGSADFQRVIGWCEMTVKCPSGYPFWAGIPKAVASRRFPWCRVKTKDLMESARGVMNTIWVVPRVEYYSSQRNLWDGFFYFFKVFMNVTIQSYIRKIAFSRLFILLMMASRHIDA